MLRTFTAILPLMGTPDLAVLPHTFERLAAPAPKAIELDVVLRDRAALSRAAISGMESELLVLVGQIGLLSSDKNPETRKDLIIARLEKLHEVSKICANLKFQDLSGDKVKEISPLKDFDTELAKLVQTVKASDDFQKSQDACFRLWVIASKSVVAKNPTFDSMKGIKPADDIKLAHHALKALPSTVLSLSAQLNRLSDDQLKKANVRNKFIDTLSHQREIIDIFVRRPDLCGKIKDASELKELLIDLDLFYQRHQELLRLDPRQNDFASIVQEAVSLWEKLGPLLP